MKKLFLPLIGLVISTIAYGQTLDSLGVDNSLSLNSYEVAHLNKQFEKERGDFHFSDKRVAFYSSVYGMGKIDYFKSVKEYALEGRGIVQELVLLTPEEKNAYGYDALVSYWNKRSINFTPRYRKNVLSSIGKAD